MLRVYRHAQAGFIPQPHTDWTLKAAEVPFDSIDELAREYGAGTVDPTRAGMEVIAGAAVQVWAGSEVRKTKATLGVWMAHSLDAGVARLGYRIVKNGAVVIRGSIPGTQLSWREQPPALVGVASMDIPDAAVVQVIASYAGHAQNVMWLADPELFMNPRAVVLSRADPAYAVLLNGLMPDTSRGRAADDLETAVAWVLWAVGFAPCSFGMHPKTRDSYDIVAATPRGHFVVVECTLGMLRAEGKLSKLSARAAGLRSSLDAANMQHLQVLPAIVTTMTRAQVAVDLPQATRAGILVLARDDLEQVKVEVSRLPDADAMFQRGRNAVDEARAALSAKEPEPPHPQGP